MIRYYVIGGTYEEARNWCSQNQRNDAKLVPLVDSLQIKGLVNPHGIFVGTWLDRPDMTSILTSLLTSTHLQSDGLDKALKLYNKHINK